MYSFNGAKNSCCGDILKKGLHLFLQSLQLAVIQLQLLQKQRDAEFRFFYQIGKGYCMLRRIDKGFRCALTSCTLHMLLPSGHDVLNCKVAKVGGMGKLGEGRQGCLRRNIFKYLLQFRKVHVGPPVDLVNDG
ncbi:hypothetical protein D3C80_1261510 [compost metagenome]